MTPQRLSAAPTAVAGLRAGLAGDGELYEVARTPQLRRGAGDGFRLPGYVGSLERARHRESDLASRRRARALASGHAAETALREVWSGQGKPGEHGKTKMPHLQLARDREFLDDSHFPQPIWAERGQGAARPDAAVASGGGASKASRLDRQDVELLAHDRSDRSGARRGPHLAASAAGSLCAASSCRIDADRPPRISAGQQSTILRLSGSLCGHRWQLCGVRSRASPTPDRLRKGRIIEEAPLTLPVQGAPGFAPGLARLTLCGARTLAQSRSPPR